MKLNCLMFIVIIYQIMTCGMNTHQEIGYRAFSKFKNIYYKNIILRNADYFQPGTAFPDWGYLCNNDGGEYAHWPPFINNYVTYIKNEYKPTDAKYEQLVALLFGIESHQIADILWHWGKEAQGTDEQGFLHSMSHGASNCEDIWQYCHNIGDSGADYYLSYRGNLKKLSDDIWKIPTQDILNIYKMSGHDIPAVELEGCVELLYLASEFEWIISSMNLKKNEINASFLTDDLDMFYNGGLDDMTIGTIWKWENIIDMLEGRASEYKYKEVIKKEEILNLKKEKMNKLKKEILSEIFDFNIFKELFGMKTGNVNQILTITQDRNILENNKITIIELIKQRLFINQNIKLPPYYNYEDNKNEIIESTVPYSYFGKSFTFGDFNGDGLDDVAIGAPGFGDIQQGAVYIIYDHLNNIRNIDYEKPNFTGEFYSRFGYSLTTVDLNHDGIDDLVISAPTWGNNGSVDLNDYYPKDYIGKIYVYYGKKEGLDKPDVEILTKSNTEIFFNLGFFLGQADCNSDGYVDLLIGSPYAQQGGNKRGSAAVFTRLESSILSYYIEDAHFYFSGEKDYMEVGHSISCSNNTILVSAVSDRPNGLQSAGSVFGFDFKEKKLLFKLSSDKAQSRFGESISIKDNLVAIGAPSYVNNLDKDNIFDGAVFIYNLQSLINGDLSYRTKIQSTVSRSRMGKYVTFGENGIIYVGSPQFSHWLEIEEGRILAFKDIIKGEISDDKASEIYSSHTNGSRFGEKIIERNGKLFGSAPFTINEDFKGQLLIIN
jgi:glycosylphosphatidylinositol phospholipase D